MKEMSKYVTLSDDAKLKLLQKHSFQAPFPTLDQKNWCLHCEQEFDGHSARVWMDSVGDYWLECGTPECDGATAPPLTGRLTPGGMRIIP